jgi:transposase
MSGSEREGGREGGKRPRRIWSEADKRRIVAETYLPGASMSVIARRHDLNTNQLFTWRRKFMTTPATPSPVTFVPATVADAPLREEAPAPCASTGRMEIILAEGARLVVDASVDATALRRVIKVLTRP